MQLGIISDSHDHTANIVKAVSLFRSESVHHLLHAGDFCSPFTIPFFEGFRMDAVFGNNDGDHYRLLAKSSKHGINIHNEFFEMECDDCRIALYHGTQPAITDALGSCGSYDLVISGHTHQVFDQWQGNTRMLNPGSAHGFDGPATVALFDTLTREVRVLEL